MKYALLFTIFAIINNHAVAEQVFVLDFSKGPSLLNPPIPKLVRLDLDNSQLPRGQLKYATDLPEWNEPKYNLARELRENAERIIGGMIIVGVAWRIYKRFQAQSPLKFSRYENGVQAKFRLNFGEE
ncbi:MAG: hypothetical protein HY398_02185 [Candidatus Doudnabacteria bacterium]|nr:hypothetical protein [Candidatus Doudnabacteria bacterium]